MNPRALTTITATLASVAALLATEPAANAGPLTQRRDATAKSDLRNLAVTEETYYTDHNRYGSIRELQSEGTVVPATGMTWTVVWYDPKNSYCASVSYTQKLQNKTRSFYYDSARGGLQPDGATGCPTKRPRTAKSGGSIQG